MRLFSPGDEAKELDEKQHGWREDPFSSATTTSDRAKAASQRAGLSTGGGSDDENDSRSRVSAP